MIFSIYEKYFELESTKIRDELIKLVKSMPVELKMYELMFKYENIFKFLCRPVVTKTAKFS